MHTIHPGNVAENKTMPSMLAQFLKRLPVERVILVADRGLLSIDNVAELTKLAKEASRKLQFILAVPARRYAELSETFEHLAFSNGIAESEFLGHRLVVAHDAERAAGQASRRRERISQKGRRASDRGAYSRFSRSVNDAELTRFIKADYQAEMFT